MYSIYRLIDPRDNCVYYIGHSMDVERRYYAHLVSGHGSEGKVAWIEELKRLNLLPVLSTIEEIDNLAEARQLEALWIEHYAELGEPLTNGIFPFRKGVKTVDVNYFRPARFAWRYSEFAEVRRNEQRERERQAVAKP